MTLRGVLIILRSQRSYKKLHFRLCAFFCIALSLEIISVKLTAAPANASGDTVFDWEFVNLATSKSTEGLYELSLQRMNPDRIAFDYLNPFALFDLGMIDSVYEDPGPLAPQIRSRLLSPNWGGQEVKVWKRGREGRSNPLSPVLMRSMNSTSTIYARTLQKGGFPTGTFGDHGDGSTDFGSFQWLERSGSGAWAARKHRASASSALRVLDREA